MPFQRCLPVMALAAALLWPGVPRGDEVPPEPLEEVELFLIDGASGTLAMPAGAPDRQTPTVVLLPDVLGGDGRAGLYTDQLLGAGFAVLDLARLPGDGGLALSLARLAQHPRTQGQPVGLLGFGAGARIAASWPGPVAVRVLLYPGCAGLDPAAVHGEAVLLLHGTRDVANPPAACTRLADTLVDRGMVARARAYAGAGYAWDYHVAAAEGASLIPRPDGAGRVRAAPWPALTEQAAAEVAGFFTVNFYGAGR